MRLSKHKRRTCSGGPCVFDVNSNGSLRLSAVNDRSGPEAGWQLLGTLSKFRTFNSMTWGLDWPKADRGRLRHMRPPDGDLHRIKSVMDLELGLVVRETAERLQNQDLEHHHRIRAAGRPPLAPSECSAPWARFLETLPTTSSDRKAHRHG